jgi:hypothetical protein
MLLVKEGEEVGVAAEVGHPRIIGGIIGRTDSEHHHSRLPDHDGRGQSGGS